MSAVPSECALDDCELWWTAETIEGVLQAVIDALALTDDPVSHAFLHVELYAHVLEAVQRTLM